MKAIVNNIEVGKTEQDNSKLGYNDFIEPMTKYIGKEITVIKNTNSPDWYNQIDNDTFSYHKTWLTFI